MSPRPVHAIGCLVRHGHSGVLFWHDDLQSAGMGIKPCVGMGSRSSRRRMRRQVPCRGRQGDRSIRMIRRAVSVWWKPLRPCGIRGQDGICSEGESSLCLPEVSLISVAESHLHRISTRWMVCRDAPQLAIRLTFLQASHPGNTSRTLHRRYSRYRSQAPSPPRPPSSSPSVNHSWRNSQMSLDEGRLISW